ncbi:MAG TPA: ABC transporter permease [Opitutaceae bacterium]|jgi:predicted permease
MKHALRQLISHPGFTIVALITLALGIGINTTAFSVLDRLLLQGLPFRDPSSLVQVWTKHPRYGRVPTAPADFFDLKEQNTVFTDLAAYQPWQETSYAETGKPPVQEGTVMMTANFLSVLGAVPELGRAPTEKESKSNAFVCLISDRFWRQQFSADPKVIGRVVRLNNRPSTIIGVTPPFLDDPGLFNGRPSFFYLDPVTESRTMRKVGWEVVLGRIKPGLSMAQAQAGLDVIAKRLEHDYPDTNAGRGLQVIAFPTNQFGDDGVHLTWTIAALSSLVLLIACINLANLQIVRTTGRSHEVAIRLALGCPKWRLMGMFILESAIMSVVGGALGLLFAIWSNAFISQFLGLDFPLNFQVIVFTFLISLLTAVLFGTVPAWMAARSDVGARLKANARGSTSDRSRRWLSQGLVLLELALALTLLTGAGFFVSGIYRLTHRDLGWNPSHETIGVIPLDQDHFGGDQNRDNVEEFGRQARERLRVLPGVQAAAISDGSPSWGGRTHAFIVEGRPPPKKGQEPEAGFFSVSPGWFEVFGMHLVQGREFTDADTYHSLPVAIVDESMAKALWPGEAALGKRFAGTGEEDKTVWMEVVGVMRDFKGVQEFFNPTMTRLRYLRPWAQDPGQAVTLMVRTSGPPGTLKEPLRKAIAALQPTLALAYDATIDEDMASTYSYFTFLRRVLGQIAVLGLLLSAIGIYGVVANLANERTKEIGIRMALGAQPASILWMFLRNGVLLAASGALLGLAGAYTVLVVLERMLPYLPGKNPWAVTGAAAVLFAVAIFACWLPARRTTRVSPMVALRVE